MHRLHVVTIFASPIWNKGKLAEEFWQPAQCVEDLFKLRGVI
jgi:hypothetical protein